MVREITVIKKPRNDPIEDKPINFPPLEGLHLELMENKKKLKKNLPPIPIPKKKPTPPPPAKEAPKPDDTPSQETIKEKSSKSASQEPKKKKKKSAPPAGEDGDLVAELGDEAELVIEELADEPTGEEVEDLAGDEGEEAADATAGDKGDAVPEEEDPYAGLSAEEREAREKEEYIWRFRILKKQYPKRNIQEYNEHDDLHMMKTSYERTVKELYLEDSVDSYRTYLIGGFMLMEWAATQYMGIDLTGFTKQQMLMMSKYERLLIELGERSYNRWGLNLPVEIRLIGFILLQAGLFYLGKIIAERGGGTIFELFKAFTGQPSSMMPGSGAENAPAEGGTAPTKKKMKGPSIGIDDLKNMRNAESE